MGSQARGLSLGGAVMTPQAARATRQNINALGMPLEQWTLGSCRAEFGVGDDWATLYGILSGNPGNGEATQLLEQAKAQYEGEGKRVGGTIALNPVMRHIYEKLGYKEYREAVSDE